MKLIIKNGTIINPVHHQHEKGDVVIEDGKIVSLGGIADVSGAEVYDAEGFFVTPGLIDMHVHLREPGQEAKEDMKLLLPSLVNNFQLLKQADDKVACDSVAHLIYEMATDIKLKLMSVEWFFQRNDPSEVLDQYSLIVKETQSMQEIELVENSLQQSLKEVKLKGELKKKAQLVFERIEDRKKWISIKEKI